MKKDRRETDYSDYRRAPHDTFVPGRDGLGSGMGSGMGGSRDRSRGREFGTYLEEGDEKGRSEGVV